MDTSALQLCSRFAYSPNQLGYCGQNSAHAAFSQCILNQNCQPVTKEIPKFKGLYPYLKTIAQVLDKDSLSYPVVEAYWLGNPSLKKFKPHHYQILIRNLRAQGLPDFFIKEISHRQPRTFIPLHLFNVLHVGVGRITGSVPFNLKSVNQCMVRWGQVTDIRPDSATINLHSLKRSSGRYRLYLQTETLPYDKKFLAHIKTGSTVAAHWNWIVKTLNSAETQHLSHWTRHLLQNL
jgi:hypothetical protein